MIALQDFAQTRFKDETDVHRPVDPSHAHGICAGLCRDWLYLRINGNNNSMPSYYHALAAQRPYVETLEAKRRGGHTGVEMVALKAEFWSAPRYIVTTYRNQETDIATRIRTLDRGTGIAICITFDHQVHGRSGHALAVARLPATGRLRFFDPNGGDKVPGGGEWGFAEGTMMLSNAHEVRSYIRQYYRILVGATIFLIHTP
jgi:hypothetical protein